MEKIALSADEILFGRYKGIKNFMTPRKIRTGLLCADVAFELSSGRLDSGKMLFGVSVVVHEDGYYKSSRLSQSFYAREDATAYIKASRAYLKQAVKSGVNIEEAVNKFLE